MALFGTFTIETSMKIGILTFHNANNYGAVLQCYAMQKVLNSMGHNAYVIDYRQQEIEKAYKVFQSKYKIRMLVHPKGSLNFWRDVFRRKKRNRLFNQYRKDFFHLSSPCYTTHDIPPMDAYIVGSDQLWNPDITNGIDEVYWGNFDRPVDSKLLTYAVSGQVQKLSVLANEQIKQYLLSFNNLSIREKSMADYISEQLGLDTHVDIDPTLLATKELWENMTDTHLLKKDYVLLYQVRGNGQLLRSKARLLAERLHCEVIELSRATCNPVEFVSLIRNAIYVVTSSFHGTAFALIFERPLFSVLLHDKNDERYESLLRRVGAASLLVEIDFDPKPILFDYAPVREKLEEYRFNSFNYLRSLVSNKVDKGNF